MQPSQTVDEETSPIQNTELRAELMDILAKDQDLRISLDTMEDMFISRVAEGRSAALSREVSKEEVISNFGRGGLLLAESALSAGMIDAVERTSRKPMEENMDNKVVEQAAHEQAVAEAREAGVKQERARVASLLTWMSADSETVTAAIKDGTEMSAELIETLSASAAQKIREEAVAQAKADAEAEVASAAQAREDEDIPEVNGVEVPRERAEDAEVEALMEEAMKLSKNKGVK